MENDSFTAVASGNTAGIAANYNGITCDIRSSTQIAICTTGQQGNGCSWRVVGYAASSEYAQSTWDYQNVQVERPMVQLFNSATDEAVATCTSVLQDVANLNMGDYVIYWDSGDATDHSHAKPGVATPASGTWYRLYKSGWVEQGGHNDGENNQGTNTFAIEMADLNYSISLGRHVISGTAADKAAISFQAHSCTTTGFTCAQTYAIVGGGGGYGTGPSYAYDWVVRGRAA